MHELYNGDLIIFLIKKFKVGQQDWEDGGLDSQKVTLFSNLLILSFQTDFCHTNLT